MDKINVWDTIAIIVMIIALFLAFFLITVKTNHKLSNRIFAFFLLLTAIDVSTTIDHLFDLSLNCTFFINTLFFLQLPTIYLYILSVCYADFVLKSKHFIHTSAFIVVNLVLLPRFYSVDLQAKTRFLEQIFNQPEIQFNHVLIDIQIILYLTLAFITIRKAKKIYLENYAGATMEFLHWLIQFTLALSFFYSVALIKNIFKFIAYPNLAERLKTGLLVFELGIIFWYLFKALLNPNLFRAIDSKLKLVKELVSEEKLHSPSFEKVNDPALIKLKQYMMDEKPFLNPSLTIQDIAVAIEIPVRELSVLINQNVNQHFYDFVNSYRIEQAKEILKDTTKSKVTILEILYEVGFNSKSSFNTAFKKHTGKTPTEFRNHI